MQHFLILLACLSSPPTVWSQLGFPAMLDIVYWPSAFIPNPFLSSLSQGLGTTFPRSPCYQVLDVILSVKYTHAGFGREKGSWSCSSSYTIVTDGIRLGFLPAILYSTVQSKTMYQLWYWQWFHTVPNHCEETASPNLWVAAVVTWCKHCTTTPYFISIPSSNFVST